ERKQDSGYHGFAVRSDPEITLEEDLLRRDLTINAIAEDDEGRLIDPYGGERDLQQRVLRHVSPAFAEDPLRILRLCRYAARYHSFGFSVAPETMTLLQEMVSNGEVDTLVAERVWQETASALLEESPAIYFTQLRQTGALGRIFPEIDRLFGVPQPPHHHPEIDCGVHTMMVLTQAARLSTDLAVRFAALVHDLGKGTTAVDLLPRHIAHEERGEKLVKELCRRLKVPSRVTELARLVTRYHGLYHRAEELRPETVLKLFQQLDLFRRPQRLEQFLLACEADSRGRQGFADNHYRQPQRLRDYFQAVMAVESQAIIAAGFRGKAIGEELQRRRIEQLRLLAKRDG
ncbi:MAG: multifunctional CCA addition/repair protein, partial [Gammaproteobacteria bacterium]|nr:multifunctional CCA addition/repair protein [Gammaproteobacteria bacterium]